MQIILNAGGQGTRLWPLSTKKVPKQFCSLLGEKSLLRDTFERVSLDFEMTNIWVSVNQQHESLIKKILPELDPKNILVEPERRDTFPAVVSHAAVVASRVGRDEPMIFLNTDQYIAPQKSVKIHNEGIKKIAKELAQNTFDIVVIGIKPTFPSTGYGYIEIPPAATRNCFDKPVKVNSYKEKPNLETAKNFLSQGNYLWNFGSFSFTFNSLSKVVSENLADTQLILEEIFEKGQIEIENFQKLEKTSFDYAVLENTNNLGMIGLELEVWDDIGGYQTLYNYLPSILNADEAYKSPTGGYLNYYEIKGKGNRVKSSSGKKVAFVGVSNLILVETEEGVLVIDPKHYSEVKKVAQHFED